MTDELRERIAVLERENAALVATLAERDSRVAELYDYALSVSSAVGVVFETDWRAPEPGPKELVVATARMHATDSYDSNDKLRRMHRRAQKAEGELYSVRNNYVRGIHELKECIERVRLTEVHWLLRYLEAANVAELAMSEGLRECERMRETITMQAATIAAMDRQLTDAYAGCDAANLASSCIVGKALGRVTEGKHEQD